VKRKGKSLYIRDRGRLEAVVARLGMQSIQERE